MAEDDWYRNKLWNQDIQNRFFEKLKRARSQKTQYLKIQAYQLLEKEPEVSMMLIAYARENCPDDFWEQEFYLYESKILSRKGKVDEALSKAKESLVWRIKRPGTQTEIPYWFAEIVLRNKVDSEYANCLETIKTLHRPTPFPVMEYKFHALAALLLQKLARHSEATEEARIALEWAEKDTNLLQNSRKKKHGIFGKNNEWPYEEVRRIVG